MFKEASYYITAHFHDGKTDAITYVKAGSESSSKGAFSDDEIEMLLKINGSGQKWERSKAKEGLQEWKTEDRKFQAVYSESKFLVITTAGYVKRLKEAAKKKKTARQLGPQDEKIEANAMLRHVRRIFFRGNLALEPPAARIHTHFWAGSSSWLSNQSVRSSSSIISSMVLRSFILLVCETD